MHFFVRDTHALTWSIDFACATILVLKADGVSQSGFPHLTKKKDNPHNFRMITTAVLMIATVFCGECIGENVKR